MRILLFTTPTTLALSFHSFAILVFHSCLFPSSVTVVAAFSTTRTSRTTTIIPTIPTIQSRTLFSAAAAASARRSVSVTGSDWYGRWGAAVDGSAAATTRRRRQRRQPTLSRMVTTGTMWDPLPPRGASSHRKRHRQNKQQQQQMMSSLSSSGEAAGDNYTGAAAAAAATTTNDSSSSSPLQQQHHDEQQQQHQSATRVTTTTAETTAAAVAAEELTGARVAEHPKQSKQTQKQQNQQQKEKQQHQQPQRKLPNRPGFNSYLKVVLDSDSLKRLHTMTLDIATRFQQESNASSSHEEQESTIPTTTSTTTAPAEEGGTGNEDGAAAMKPNTKAQRGRGRADPNKRAMIKPRSEPSLHMTFFFGGETLCNLSPHELETFHQHVSRTFFERGFLQNQLQEKEQQPTNKQEKRCSTFPVNFRIKELRLFPPKRNNLIVAELDAPEEWHALHDAIRTLAQTAEYSPSLRDVTTYSKERWTPHITLANVHLNLQKNSAKQNHKEQQRLLSKVLADPFLRNTPPLSSEELSSTTTAIGMKKKQ